MADQRELSREELDILRQNFAALEEHLGVRYDGLRTEMRHLGEVVLERVAAIEGKLLQAFYGFTQSITERFRSADEAEASLKKRLTVLEERLTELERRLAGIQSPAKPN